ncbi:hypothetical protein CDN98_06755 [Roseateles terrae]|nr:hypothetical protein CDN98_06755 [Roseateles terrae]
MTLYRIHLATHRGHRIRVEVHHDAAQPEGEGQWSANAFLVWPTQGQTSLFSGLFGSSSYDVGERAIAMAKIEIDKLEN